MNPYRTVTELIHAQVGRPAVVMGGGEHLPTEVAAAPQDAVFISANQHGALLRRVDYIVSLDKRIEPVLRQFDVTLVSNRDWGDVQILNQPAAESGIAAAWFARLLGCAPIVITGMDCYSGGTYWHDPGAPSNGFTLTPDKHLARWRLLAMGHPTMYRVIDGPLLQVFPRYDPNEPAEIPSDASADAIYQQVHGTRVKFLRPEGRFLAGEVVEINQNRALRLARAKIVKRID